MSASRPHGMVFGRAWRTGLAFVLALAWLVLSSDAQAACTDPPAPEVNWQRCIFDGQDLRDVDLSSARLRDASFFRADLSRSDLTGVSGFKAKFINAVMREAKLDQANVSEAPVTKGHLPCWNWGTSPSGRPISPRPT